MAWWNEVLGLLHDEWRHLGESGRPTVDPAESLREAQKLLHRTTRELEEAQARAEAARRRLSRARQAIEELAAKTLPHGFSFEWTELALQEKLACLRRVPARIRPPLRIAGISQVAGEIFNRLVPEDIPFGAGPRPQTAKPPEGGLYVLCCEMRFLS